MNGETFVATVERLLAPALAPLGFLLHSSVSGRLYLVEFVSPHHVLSISFEPGDEFLQAVVFTVAEGTRSDSDDRTATPRLSDLNQRFLRPQDAQALIEASHDLQLNDPSMARLIKLARELAIVVPRYLAAK